MINVLARTMLGVLISTGLSCAPASAEKIQGVVHPTLPTWSAPVSFVRLRNPASSQCLYVDGNGPLVKSWGCWKDPGMTFLLETRPDGQKQLRNERTRLCIYGGFANSSTLFAMSCGGYETGLQIVSQGGNLVQIKLPLIPSSFGGWSPRCVTSGSSNGAQATKQWCTSLQNQQFVLEYV
jgi:hypothetical protein